MTRPVSMSYTARRADQSALDGLLTKVRDLGLCPISVRRLDTGQA